MLRTGACLKYLEHLATGLRMGRGDSWMAVPEAVYGVSGATYLPLKESSIVGFRAAK